MNPSALKKQNNPATYKPSGLVNPESGDDGTLNYIQELAKNPAIIATTTPHPDTTIHQSTPHDRAIRDPTIRGPVITQYDRSA
jgi:hypothetical protein